MDLLDEIEAFLERTGMSATAFGKQALNDPPLVQQIRAGRDVKTSTVKRLRAFMAEWKDHGEEPGAEKAA